MKSFSQRMGLKPVKVEIQRECADDELRTALWNALYLTYLNSIHYTTEDNTEPIQGLIYLSWMNHFGRKYDELDGTHLTVGLIKNKILKSTWHEMFDLLEFIPYNFYLDESSGGNDNEINLGFYSWCNSILELHLSAYRFVNKLITEITSAEEIQEIETAISIDDKFSTVKTHLNQALNLFSNRINPDYRNSIKESISAIESLSNIITGNPKSTLGQALKEIEKSHSLHPALKSSFSSLYGYTSEADGIRHALLEESDLKGEDARFMLIACSAFVNYLIIKSAEII